MTTAAGSESSSSSTPATAAAVLPVGFRFRPTDEELVRHYLKAKIAGRAHPDLLAIPDVDLAAVEPWDLPARSVIKSDDPEWFFFARRDRPKYPGKSSRSCRSTAAGYWKATGKDRLIRAPGPGGCRGKGALIGVKKTLVFHRGRAPRGARTPWIMHEYTATDPNPQSQSQSQSAGPQNDSFVLYRLFNKQDEETPAPVSEPPSTSPPANPPLQQADDTASASMVEDKASPSDSSQLTPTNATTDHTSTAHLLAAAGDAEQIADQDAAYLNMLAQLPAISSPMRPYTDLPFVGNMGDEQEDFSMYLNNIIGEQDVQAMLPNPADDETGVSNPTGSWTPYPQDMLDMINSIGPMGAAPWTQQQQQATAPVELMDPQQGIAARRIRLAYAVERASASQPILACHSESEEGEGESAGCSTESSSNNHEEEDHVNDALFQTMAGDLMHNITPAQALLVSWVEVADKLQHLSFNDDSILEEEDAKPSRGAGLKQRVKQDSGRNGHDPDGLLRNSAYLPGPGDSFSETARRRRSLWLALLVMAIPLLVLVLVGVWRSLSYRPV
ncbi:LOW QUALITY PROTEIN: NAC domain-containing protein 91-like [Triticum urartu]|uniref:LOW QUALITY PROTEIN: NAC domain-containing protein 91-like n=1 Tax=Triticum urartu TaxID=4572 RepID=UPI002044419C|nr:LOW QUALITY PROTEIN: NAC domain-containing protein 91-like [Triticum urartu]